MSSIENLSIPENKKKYITEKLSPILEELVTDVITEMPESLLNFMHQWIAKKCNIPCADNNAADQIKALQSEIVDLKNKNRQTTVVTAELESKKDDLSESEDDDDDYVDELPENFIKSEAAASKPRTSVSAEVYGLWNVKKEFTPPVFPKSDEAKMRIRKTLGSSFLFSNLSEKEFEVVIDALQEQNLTAGTRIIKQGDDGDFMFVIEKGKLQCIKASDGEEKVVKTCEEGDAFGELALLYNVPRAASVESVEDCTLWQLDRETFNHIVKDSAAKKRQMYEKFLENVSLLDSMDAYERSQVADALKVVTYDPNTDIIKQGEVGNNFFLIEEGEAEAYKLRDGQDTATKVMSYGRGDYFGELALLKDEPRAATVKSVSKCSVLCLDRKSFRRLLGPLSQMMERQKYM